ncbi:MAG: helix-turn-helix domain-containing protein [Burkholderiales bacterium]|nr:helix-turn-helix domain-containing protein [Burkholderiales bacterium]
MSDSAADTGASAGALLRAAREQRGLHIAALAAAIKVAPRKLDALENDRWSELPDATFTRALAQTVCRTLKIDAGPVLERLPPAAAATLEGSGGGLNMPFRDRPGREGPGLAGSAIRPLVWAAGLLMLAALALYFLPSGLWSRHSSASGLAESTSTPTLPAIPPAQPAAGSGPSEPAVSLAQPAAEPASSPQPLEAASAPALAAATGGVPASSLSAASASPASSPAAAVAAGRRVAAAASLPPAVAAEPASTSAGAGAVGPAGAVRGTVQLRTSGPSWVEARDANGQVLLSRLLQPGERLGLDGALPIRLVIGDATVTQLQFRGQPVDLAPSTRDNVARLQLR